MEKEIELLYILWCCDVSLCMMGLPPKNKMHVLCDALY